MKNFKEGVLVYDENTERMDIRFGLEDYYGGLHCGEGFEVFIEKKWFSAGIELGDDWYLLSNDITTFLQQNNIDRSVIRGKENLVGLRVRKLV